MIGVRHVAGNGCDPVKAVGGLRERIGTARINHEPPAALVERAGESKA